MVDDPGDRQLSKGYRTGGRLWNGNRTTFAEIKQAVDDLGGQKRNERRAKLNPRQMADLPSQRSGSKAWRILQLLRWQLTGRNALMNRAEPEKPISTANATSCAQ